MRSRIDSHASRACAAASAAGDGGEDRDDVAVGDLGVELVEVPDVVVVHVDVDELVQAARRRRRAGPARPGYAVDELVRTPRRRSRRRPRPTARRRRAARSRVGRRTSTAITSSYKSDPCGRDWLRRSVRCGRSRRRGARCRPRRRVAVLDLDEHERLRPRALDPVRGADGHVDGRPRPRPGGSRRRASPRPRRRPRTSARPGARGVGSSADGRARP